MAKNMNMPPRPARGRRGSQFANAPYNQYEQPQPRYNNYGAFSQSQQRMFNDGHGYGYGHTPGRGQGHAPPPLPPRAMSMNSMPLLPVPSMPPGLAGHAAGKMFACQDVRLKPGGNFRKKNNPGYNRKEKADKVFTNKANMQCPLCKRYFDLAARSPLVLYCNHSMCEDCIDRKLTEGTKVKCAECAKECTVIKPAETDFNLKDHFPINYYLAGRIFFNRGPDAELSSLQFVPAGCSSPNSGAVPPMSFGPLGRGPVSLFEKCSTTNCNEEASLRCVDCDEVYCKLCSDKLHQKAKGLKQHKISAICIAQCAKHNGNPQDFCCYNCNNYFCTYCIIDDHKDHKFKQITKLETEDRERFNDLLASCNDILKKLKSTHQIVKKRIDKIKPKQVNEEIEKTISKCFLDLHAKLQKIERSLLLKASAACNSSLESLHEVERELGNNIAVLSDLIALAHNVKKRNFNAWQNIDLIIQRMVNATKLQHSLLVDDEMNASRNSHVDFEFVDFTDDWATHFKVAASTKKKYKLVGDNEEVEGYTNILDSQSDTSSISEITIGSNCKPNVKSVYIQSGEQENRLKEYANSIKFQPDTSIFSSDEAPSASPTRGHDYTPVSLSQLTPTVFAKGMKENVLVTHVMNPSKFYVQLAKHYKAIQNLHKQLEYFVQKLYVGNVKTPVDNKLYLVKYDNGITTSWRRGIVTQIDGAKQECQVKLIDFGNNIEVHFDNMRTINEEAANISPFAIECQLHNLCEPPAHPWNEDDANLIAEMMSGSNAIMVIRNVLSAFTFEVDLIIYTHVEEFSLRDSLIFLGRAFCVDESDDEAVMITSPKPESKEKQLAYNEQPLKINESNMVVISHIVNAITLYVQVVSLDEFQSKLRFAMTDFYAKDVVKNKLYSPKVGMPVAIREYVSPILSYWNRGLITDVNRGAGSVKVLLVDLGKELTVFYEDIRKLNQQYLAYARMAIRVRLAHVNYQNEKQNEMAINFLEKLDGQHLKMVVHAPGDEPEVTLFEVYSTVDLCINAQLVQNGLKTTGFISSMLEWPREECEIVDIERETLTSSLVRQSQGAINEEDSDDSEDESVGQKIEPVKVLNVMNPHCIYVHLCENDKFMLKLAQLNRTLQNHYSVRQLDTRDEWQIGETAVAYDTKTKLYFRVTINKCLKDNSYEVFSQDYANIFMVKNEGIGQLNEEFCGVPPLALKVKLYGVYPLGSWSMVSTDCIKDWLKGKTNVSITKVKTLEDEEKMVSVVLWIRFAKPVSALEKAKVKTINVNKMLCRSGLAKLIKGWELPKPKPPQPQELPADGNLPEDYRFIEQMVGVPYSERKWLPPRPTAEKSFQAVATYVDETGCVFYYMSTEEPMLKNMEEAISDHFATVQIDTKINEECTWEVGNLCTVKYHQNQKWYRGEVVGFNNDENEVRVCMIDYGNVEDVKYNEISKEVMFLDVPRVAKVLRLHDVRPKKGFSTCILDKLHAGIVEKVIDVRIIEEATAKKPASAILTQGTSNINLFIQNEIKRGGAQTQAKSKSQTSLSQASTGEQHEDDVLIEEIIEGNSTVSDRPSKHRSKKNISLYQRRAKTGYTYIELPKRDFFEVSIISIIDLNRIVFELAIPQSDTSVFDDLQEDINSNWHLQPVVDTLVEGQPCIARYQADQRWYRGMLLKRNDSLLVHFVDFGNAEVVAADDIRVMKVEWLKQPVEQFLATLSDFELVIQNHALLITAVNQHLAQYVETTKLAKITSRDPLSIQLFNADTQQLSYLELMETGVLKSFV